MNPVLVHGYLVVQCSQAAYHGVDREPWEQIDIAYHEGRLPRDLSTLYQRMRSDASRGFWWPTASSLVDAKTLLHFSSSHDKLEILGVRSKYLAEAVGRVGTLESEAVPLGVDVVSIGEWSLLRAMLQGVPTSSIAVLPELNRFGLLNSESDLVRVEHAYSELCKEGRVEPIASGQSPIGIEAVWVYRVGGIDPDSG